MKIRVGSRGSLLALTQAREVIYEIKKRFPDIDIELIIIKTLGDKDLQSFEKINTIGVFVKEIEEALIKNKIDIAVHSLKDLPTLMPEELDLGAVLKRANSQDVLISTKYSWDDLPENALIGTSSLRRRAQLLNACPNLKFTDLRGNIETRLKKLISENLDAIVCAHAAFIRLNILDGACRVAGENYLPYSFTPLPKEIMLPAVCQGIIGIEFKRDNLEIKEILKKINHDKTFFEASAERQFLNTLGGGCLVPAGAIAEIKGNAMEIEGFHANNDGTNLKREKLIYPLEKMNEIGQDLAEKLKTGNRE